MSKDIMDYVAGVVVLLYCVSMAGIGIAAVVYRWDVIMNAVGL